MSLLNRPTRCIVAFCTASLILGCGDSTDGETQAPQDLGSIDVATGKADGTPESVVLEVAANSERTFNFKTDSLGLVLRFTQPNTTSPQPNRVHLERQSYNATPFETESATEHEGVLFPDRSQVRRAYDYVLVVTNEGSQPLQLVMSMAPYDYDPCHEIVRTTDAQIALTPLGRCSTISSVDEGGHHVLQDVDLCVVKGTYPADYPVMFRDPNKPNYLHIVGYTDYITTANGELWPWTIRHNMPIPSNYRDDKVSEDEDTVELYSAGGGYIDGNPALVETNIVFYKHDLVFDFTQKIRRDRLLSRWQSNYAFTLACDPYEIEGVEGTN